MGTRIAPDVAALARALADPTRSAMCLALLDGRRWTAGELAREASVARSTATEHLNLLVDAGVVAQEHRGRHRYVRLADDDVADLIEAFAARAHRTARGPAHFDGLRSATKQAALARARTCYDHLAGSLGVAVTDALLARGLLSRRRGWALTADGEAWLESLGVDVENARAARRPLVRTCVDWTERRPHLAGGAGAALCDRFFATRWIERIGSDRAVRLTPAGDRELRRTLDLRWTPADSRVPFRA